MKKNKRLLATTIIASTLLMTACNVAEDTKVEQTEEEQALKKSVTNTDLKNDTNSEGIKEDTGITFTSKEDKYYNAEFHNGWKISPSKLLQGTIDGRGEEAGEEGLAVLVVKNNETNISTVYELTDNEEAQLTPKVMEWIDDNRAYVIVGFSYGTVSKGGNLYELNLKENTANPVFDDLSDKEEIVSIEKNTDGTFTYKKHTYTDDNYNEGVFETGTLSVSPLK